jgi:hypothetical protein
MILTVTCPCCETEIRIELNPYDPKGYYKGIEVGVADDE